MRRARWARRGPTLTRACRAAIRAKAEEYRLRAQAIAPSVRRPRPLRPPALSRCRASLAPVERLFTRPAQAQAQGMATMAQAAQVGAGLASQGTQAVRAAGGASTMGAAATLAAVGGAVVMGPLTAVAAGAAAAYATTRGDDVGDMARAAGKQAITAVEKAKGVR